MDEVIVSVEPIQTEETDGSGLNSSTQQPTDLTCQISPCISANNVVDQSKRDFLLTASCVLAGIGGVTALVPLFSSLMPNPAIQKLVRSVHVDVSFLQPGAMLTVEWDNKPIFILHRTAIMLENLRLDLTNLRDPESRVDQQPAYAQNIYRSINPEYIVLVGLCTHLGCVPQYMSHSNNNIKDCFYCPCHGSSFDTAGRVFKNVPAPINLAVPPYHFKNKHLLVIGESA